MNEVTFFIIAGCILMLIWILFLSLYWGQREQEDTRYLWEKLEHWRNAYVECVTQRNKLSRQVQGLRSHVSRLCREKKNLTK